jgi:endonuclease YncB( thermonuclease family)
MKKLFLVASAALLTVSLFAQTPAKKAEDVVKFNELSFDFGKVKKGTPVTHDFNFANISNSPVIIESAIPSCGCTTPKKPEGAVSAGKSDSLSVQYNAANPGPFNKSITVKLAGIDLPLTLKITGEVLEADAYAKYQTSKPAAPGQ